MTEQPARALTSTVSGTAFGLATTAAAALLGGLVVVAASAPASVVVVTVVVIGAASACALALPTRVSVGVNEDGVRYRRSGGRQRWIPAESIEAAEAVRVGYGAVLGWRVPATRATDRRIVRAGWTLRLRLRTHEQIWLSTRGPLDAAAILRPAAQPIRGEGRR
jgi:hypothetical protein